MAITASHRVGRFEQRERLRPDIFLLVSFLVLSALGILMVYTATAPRLIAQGEAGDAVMRKQVVFVIIGTVVFLVSSLIDTRRLRAATPLIYMLSLGSLILVLTPLGDVRAGAQRWIELGSSIQLQPSEPAKVAVILALAALLARDSDGTLHWRSVGRAIGLVVLPAVLIFRQPDLGTMLVFGFIAVAMLFAAGTSLRQMGFLVVSSIFGTVALFQFKALQAYQLTRLTAFLDQSSSLENANYNQFQSEVAIGSGGFLGKGVFNGTQTNLSFVPAQATDFIFTAVGEQLGFIGGAVVLGLFAVIIWRLMLTAVVAHDTFGSFIAVGVASMIAFHVFVNVGMTMSLLPVTGLPLPFLSNGGTAFVTMSLALGLAHSAWIHRAPLPGERR